jgi:hypothetical protein
MTVTLFKALSPNNWPCLRRCLQMTVTQFKALSHIWLPAAIPPINCTVSTLQAVNFEGSVLPSDTYIFNRLPFFHRTFIAHDVQRKMPPDVWISTVVPATAATPECLQLHCQVVLTWRRNTRHLDIRLCVAAAGPVAWQSGCCKYVDWCVNSGLRWVTVCRQMAWQSGCCKYVDWCVNSGLRWVTVCRQMAWQSGCRKYVDRCVMSGSRWVTVCRQMAWQSGCRKYVDSCVNSGSRRVTVCRQLTITRR